MQKSTKLCFNNWHLNELKVSWNVLVNLYIEEVTLKSIHSDIKCQV